MGWTSYRFFKTLLALAASIPLLLAASGSRAETIEFRGGGTLNDFTSGCATYGWPVGGSSAMTARFRPPNLADNGPNTRLAFFWQTWATSFVLASGKLTNKFKNVTGGSTASGTYQYDIQSKMKVTTMQPKTITANTKDILIVGTIQGFDWLPTCQVNFRVTLSRRP